MGYILQDLVPFIEQYAVYFNVGLFLIWLLLLFYAIIRKFAAFRQIRFFHNVNELCEYQEDEFYQDEGGDDRDDVEIIEEAGKYYDDYCRENKVPLKKPIAEHVKIIFLAGIENHHLDTHELIRHTENRVFGLNSLLKGMSSLFIVVGLLGTLAGLADSLTSLNLSLDSIEKGTDVANIIGQLFTQLGDAFIPSLIGVIFTIVSVISLLIYIKFSCEPLRNRLTDATLKIWIPRLNPTKTQKIIETLEASERQLRSNFDAAKKVAEFAEDVQSQFDQFGSNLTKANKVIKNISTALEKFQESGQAFSDSVIDLSANQEELKVYFQALNHTNTALTEYISSNKDAFSNLHDTILNSFQESYKRNDKIIDSFETLRDITDRIDKLASAAETAFYDITKMNAAIIESLKQPLIDELRNNLGMVSNTFDTNTRRIADMITRIDTPMKDAANSISSTMGYLAESYNNMTRRIEESSRSNQDVLKPYLEENKGVFNRVTEQMEKLSVTSETIEKLTEVINSNYAALSANLNQDVLKAYLEENKGVFNRLTEQMEKTSASKEAIEKLTEVINSNFASLLADLRSDSKGDSKETRNSTVQASSAQSPGKTGEHQGIFGFFNKKGD